MSGQGFDTGDPVWLPLTDEWIGILADYRELGSNLRLLGNCCHMKADGVERVEATIARVNVPMGEQGYAHYAIVAPSLSTEAIDVEHDDIEARS